MRTTSNQTDDREPPPQRRAAAFLGLAFVALLAGALGLAYVPLAPQGAIEAIDRGAASWATPIEGSAPSEWFEASLFEVGRAAKPLAEPPTHFPKRHSLASQGLDLGPSGGKTQDTHPDLTLPGNVDLMGGRRRGPRACLTSPLQSWRAPVRGARAPPRLFSVG